MEGWAGLLVRDANNDAEGNAWTGSVLLYAGGDSTCKTWA